MLKQMSEFKRNVSVKVMGGDPKEGIDTCISYERGKVTSRRKDRVGVGGVGLVLTGFA